MTSSSQLALIAAVETLKYLFLGFQFVTRLLYFVKTALKLAALQLQNNVLSFEISQMYMLFMN